MIFAKNLYLFLILILVNTFLIKNYFILSKKINLFDIPNNSRKIHNQPIPLLGGILIFFNFFLFFFFEFFFTFKVHLSDTFFLEDYFLNSRKDIFSFIFTFLGLFLLGYVDDKINLDPFKKLMVFFLLFYFFFQTNNFLVIENINLRSFDFSFNLGALSLFTSIIFYIFFINSINMLDGINGLAGLTALNIFIFFYLKSFMPVLAIALIITIIFFLILNLQGKIFLGDSGSYILAFLIGYFFITSYKIDLLKLDEIFLLCFIPILDSIRLFLFRIFKTGKPWAADDNHLHHLLLKKYKYSCVLLIFFTIMSISLLILLFLKLNFYLVILLPISIYILLYSYLIINK